VAEHNPDAVARGPDGYLMLDYDKATGDAVPHQGGVKPREGLQAGGTPSEKDFDIIERFWPSVERTESGGNQFDPNTGQPLRSIKGATGVAQVMPATAPEAAKLAGLEFDQRRFENDADYNRKLGQAYLREQHRVFGDPALALAAYNAGPGRLRQALAKAQESGGSFVNYLPTETQQYLVKTGAMPGDAVAKAGVKPSGRSDFFGGPPIEFASKTAENPKGKPFDSYKDFFTSRQFLIPFGAGLAGMASSPSRYLGSAILQGVGSGLGAYGAMEEQQAKVQEAVARTGLTEAQAGVQKALETETEVRTAGGLIKDINNIPHIWARDKRTGVVNWVNFNGEYRQYPDRYEMVVQGPAAGGLGAGMPGAGGAGTAGVGAGATADRKSDTLPAPGIKPIPVERRDLAPLPGTEAAPAAPAAGGVKPPEPAAAAAPATPFAFTNDVTQRAEQEARERTSMNTDTIRDMRDVVQEAAKVAEGSNSLLPTLVQIGVLGSTPRTGFLQQGRFQPIAFEVARGLNDFASRIPALNQLFPNGEIFNERDIGDYIAWNKKIEELSKIAAGEGNQTAVEALERMRKIFPTPSQEPAGFAKNMAELLLTNQKNVQKAKFLEDYANTVRKRSGDTRYPGRLMPGVEDVFEREYGGIFEKHRDALESMLRVDKPEFQIRARQNGREELIKDEYGRPMSWFAYLQKNGQNLTPRQVAEIERRFNAPGIMAYFRTGMGGQ
jgi:hypothetical protein